MYYFGKKPNVFFVVTGILGLRATGSSGGVSGGSGSLPVGTGGSVPRRSANRQGRKRGISSSAEKPASKRSKAAAAASNSADNTPKASKPPIHINTNPGGVLGPTPPSAAAAMGPSFGRNKKSDLSKARKMLDMSHLQVPVSMQPQPSPVLSGPLTLPTTSGGTIRQQPLMMPTTPIPPVSLQASGVMLPPPAVVRLCNSPQELTSDNNSCIGNCVFRSKQTVQIIASFSQGMIPHVCASLTGKFVAQLPLIVIPLSLVPIVTFRLKKFCVCLKYIRQSAKGRPTNGICLRRKLETVALNSPLEVSIHPLQHVNLILSKLESGR